MSQGISKQHQYEFGPFRLIPAEYRLLRNGEAVPLTDKAYQLLLVLVETPGQLCTREELIERLWPDTVVEEQNLTWTMSQLRRALSDENAAPAYIETVRGKGYRLLVAVTTATVEPPPKPHRRARRWLLAAVIVVLAAAAGAIHLFRDDTAANAPTPYRLAVLPFENLSVDPANAYFTDGIHDTISTRLAGISALNVIARSSTRDLIGQSGNPRAISRQLGGIGALLEGSVQRSGEQMLINLRLIDVDSGEHLWAQSYTGSLDRLFDMQSDVAEKVATALQTALLPAEALQVTQHPTGDAQAYDIFLKAEYLAAQVERGASLAPAETIVQALDLYQQAIARDPNFALAYARLSYLLSHAHWFGLAPETPGVDMAAAEAAARQALALDADAPQSQLAIGYVHYWGERDYEAALEAFGRARQRLPNDADLIAATAYVQRRTGHWQRALVSLEQATVLDPRNPNWFLSLADMLTTMYRYPEAVSAYEKVLEIEPGNYNAVTRMLWAMLAAGDTEAARQILDGIPPDIDPGGAMSMVRAELGRLTRQPALTLSALENAPDWALGPQAIGPMPTSILVAQARQLSGDEERARRAWQQARAQIQQALSKRPDTDDADILSLLARAETGLGNFPAALEAAQRAVDIRPLESDAFNGPLYLMVLAQAHAAAGDYDNALKILRDLLAIPSGVFISRPLLTMDGAWDVLRDNPRFIALLEPGIDCIACGPVGTPQ